MKTGSRGRDVLPYRAVYLGICVGCGGGQSRLAEGEKDLEILLLRQQLRIVERKQERGPQIPRWQKVPLAALVLRLKQKARQSHKALEESVRLFKPATVIGWH